MSLVGTGGIQFHSTIPTMGKPNEVAFVQGHGFYICETENVWVPLSTKATVNAAGIVTALANSFVSGSGVAGIDDTAQTVVSLVIPMNTVVQVGDRLRVRTFWRGDVGSPITATLDCHGVTIADTTDLGAATFHTTETWLHYVDASHANVMAMGNGSMNQTVSMNNVEGFAWASDQTLAMRQSQALNNHLVVYAVLVDVFPKGVF